MKPAQKRKMRMKALRQEMLIVGRAFAIIKSLPLANRIRIAWRLVDTSPVIWGRR